MPKVIPELRQRLLDAARRRLLESDAHDLSIRQVAADCHTAVGTVYNYFPSKEALMAAAMMGDWLDCVEAMQAAADARNAPMETMREIVMALRRFACQCAPIWRNSEALGLFLFPVCPHIKPLIRERCRYALIHFLRGTGNEILIGD